MPEETLPNPAIQTIDQLLSHFSKILEAGQSISIPLYKGPTTQSVDPIKRVQSAQSRQQDVSSDCRFPRMAKFTETTVKPDFQTQPWKDARLYEEDIPKVIDESDDEDGSAGGDGSNVGDSSTNTNNPNSTASLGNVTSAANIKPKKRRWKRFEAPKRHWVLQEPKEFMEKLYIKQLKKTDPSRAASLEKSVAARLSQRYHGSSEDKNTSQYAILSLQNNSNTMQTHPPSANPSGGPYAVTVTKIHGFHNFTQSHKTKTLSMQDAERFIWDRRALHDKMSEKPTTKARLLNKLTNHSSILPGKKNNLADGEVDDGDDDDVMADIAFRETKGIGRTVRARKELLSTFGGDLAIDDDGVIGGANDSEFGGKRQIFNRYVQSDRERDQETDDLDDMMINSVEKGLDDRAAAAVSTSEGLAMDDDFYQRDVAMEYEDLDYDANEQFDDDDVDIGDGNEDIGGFTADVDEDEEEDMEEEDMDEDDISQPLFKDTNKEGALSDSGSNTEKSDDEQSLNPPQKKMKLTSGAEDLSSPTVPAQPIAPADQLDENGDRILTFEAVRKEIWLHSGRILLMQLAKIYNITKKTSTERRTTFVTITKELCISEDTINGKMLVLKQHYAKLG